MRFYSWPAAGASRTLAVAGTVALLAVSCGGCGSPTAPGGSGGVSGTWTGTLSRPDGLTPIAVRREAIRTDGPMTGPITLTNGSSSVTFQLVGVVAGPKGSVASIHFNFSANPGAITTMPNCSILANDSVDAANLKQPITSITTTTFRINYSQCPGFPDATSSANFRTESGGQLVMTKQ